MLSTRERLGVLSIDSERLRRDFEAYSDVGAADRGGLHRLALTDEDAAVRDRFVSDLEALDLDVRIDELGNVFGRRGGSDDDAAPVLIGSHLDSQPSGGRYDGQLGVLVALETLRVLDDEGVETDRPVEIVDWTNEEGSRFKPALFGSGAFVGELSVEEALATTDRDGVSVAEELERIGYDGDEPCEPHDIHACLELHVEQGPTLEERGNSVGVVDGVFGMAWLEAAISGQADHAGPSPMHTRNDALVAAANAVEKIATLPRKLSDDAVATVGEFGVSPDSINVVPDEATFTVDVRSYDDSVVEEAVERVESEIATACDREGTTYELEEIWRIPHTEFSPTVRNAVADAAETSGVSFQHIVSGAGHDAKYVNDVADTGMIFVPSVDGRTHAQSEYTEWDDVVAGATVFANATRELATR